MDECLTNDGGCNQSYNITADSLDCDGKNLISQQAQSPEGINNHTHKIKWGGGGGGGWQKLVIITMKMV